MNLDHLRYFCDAVDFKSLAKSAKANNVSPGAVSQAIVKLEGYFNQDLLYHKKKSFELTDKGVELYKMSLSLLSQFGSIENEIRSPEKMSGEFFFITQQSIAENFLPKKLAKFKKEHSNIIPKFTLGNTTIVSQRLKDRTVEFGITLDNVLLENCHTKTLFEGEFVLYGDSKLKDQFILTGETNEVRALKKKYYEKFSKELGITMEISSWGVLKKMANEGQGITFLPDYLLSRSERKKIIPNNLGLGRFPYKIIATWPKSKPLSLKSYRFIESLV